MRTMQCCNDSTTTPARLASHSRSATTSWMSKVILLRWEKLRARTSRSRSPRIRHCLESKARASCWMNSAKRCAMRWGRWARLVVSCWHLGRWRFCVAVKVTMYAAHPSRELNDLFAHKPYQGAAPELATFLFIGLDANYDEQIAEKPIFPKILE